MCIKSLSLVFFFVYFSFCLNTFSQTKCITPTSQTFIESENLKTILLFDMMFWDRFGTQVSGFTWPKNDLIKKSLVFSSSLWFGGKDKSDNSLLLSAQSYGISGTLQTNWAGPVNPNTLGWPGKENCDFWNRHFVMDKTALDSFLVFTQQNNFPIDESLIPNKIKDWPGKGNRFLKEAAKLKGISDTSSFDFELAPFRDINSNGVYDPQNGDYPDLGNRSAMVWWVSNDKGSQKLFPIPVPSVASANLETQILVSAYPATESTQFLKNTLFYDYKIINKGTKTLDSCVIGNFFDFDLGNYNDDLLQCNVSKNMVIGFNGDNFDEGITGYGENPPAIAFKVLDGPLAYPNDLVDNNRNGTIDEPNEKVLFSNFITLNNIGVGIPEYTTDPNGPVEFWNMMQNRWKNGNNTTYGAKGINPISSSSPRCKFMYPGTSDPHGFGVGGSIQNPKPMPEWTEVSAGNTPGDRRGLMLAGPFPFSPGQSIHFSTVNLIAYGGTNLQNVIKLNQLSDSLESVLSNLTSNKPAIDFAKVETVVFPNPASASITISSTQRIEKIVITDFLGKEVYSGFPNQFKTVLDVKYFSPGLYFLQTVSNQRIKSIKFLKE